MVAYAPAAGGTITGSSALGNATISLSGTTGVLHLAPVLGTALTNGLVPGLLGKGFQVGVTLTSLEALTIIGELTGVNGRLQDLRNNYSLLRDLYEQAWLRSNRPYFLRNNLERYDFTIQLWLSRIDRMRTAQRQWANAQTVSPASDLGIPAPFVPVH